MGSWKDNRPAGHDELVALCLDNIDKIAEQCGWPAEPFAGKPASVVTEQPCGRGFADLVITWSAVPPGENLDRRRWKPGRLGIVLEVKSEREIWTAGDVLRQLKTYRQALVCSDGDEWNTLHAMGLQHARYDMALFSGRPVTKIERQLLEHEGVVVISAP